MGRKKLPEGSFVAEVTDLSHDGRGLAKIDGKVIFLPLALPGEKVEFEYTNRKSKYDEGRVTKIIDPSLDRVEPFCEYYGVCGGCSFQHMSVDAQILHKQKKLENNFKHFGNGVEPETWLPVLKSSKQKQYRHKARLGVRFVYKKNKLLIGFREKYARYLADIDKCEVLHESIGEKIPELQKFISSLSNYDQIAQIEIAVDDNVSAIIIRHLTVFTQQDYKLIELFAKDNSYWIYLQSKGPETIYRYYPKANIEPKKMSYSLNNNIAIDFEPNDFTQINSKLNPLMVDLAVELLNINKDDIILDLFCGLGNFSLPIAKKANYVIGVEGSHEMTIQAKANAIKNNLNNIDFFTADLFKPLKDLPFLSTTKFSKLFLDPPRSGAENICLNIELINPDVIVYIACDTATLARDAGILVNTKGYKMLSAGIMDMFPHTSHVESIALFHKK